MGSSTVTGPAQAGIALPSAWTIELALGAFALAVGLGLVGFLDAQTLALLVALGITQMVLGIREIVVGIAMSSRRRAIRVLEVAAGIFVVVLGSLVAIFPGFGVTTLIGFLFLGLFVFGAAQLVLAIASSSMSTWFRGYLLAVGMLNLLLGPLLQLTPAQPRLTLILLALAAFVVDGIAVMLTAWTVDRMSPPWSVSAALRLSLK